MVAITGATITGLIIAVAAVVVVLVVARSSVRMVRPTHRGLVERLGKYNRYAGPGIHGVIPIIERMYRVDIREILVEAQPQTIITNDNLNAKVDAQVYLKVKADEETSRPRSTTSPTTSTRSSTWRAPRCVTSSARSRSNRPTPSAARSTRSCARRSRPRRPAGASRSCAQSSRRSTRRATCRRP